MSLQAVGQIVYWNGHFGFIKPELGGDSVFFHKTAIDPNYEWVVLLDWVRYTHGLSKQLKHIGEPQAFNVSFLKNGDFNEFSSPRTIGKLTRWNGKNGLIKSPEYEKPIVFYPTRLVKRTSSKIHIQEENLFVLAPVKSSKNPSDLFAFFAYPLEAEWDASFLASKRNLWPEDTERQLSKLEATTLSTEEQFINKLNRLTKLSKRNENEYPEVVNLLNEFKRKGYHPPISLLDELLPEHTLIMLWENSIINGYVPQKAIQYFLKADAGTKRFIIHRFKSEDKKRALLEYFSLIQRKKQTRYLNNNLKTFLDILYRNEASADLQIYEEVKPHLLSNLSEKDLTELYLKGYLDDLPPDYLFLTDKIEDLKSFLRGSYKSKHLARQMLENYLVPFATMDSFKGEKKFIDFLWIYHEHFSSDAFSKIIKEITINFKKEDLFVLWLYLPREDFDFDGHHYFANEWQIINPFFLLRYFLLFEKEVDKKHPSHALISQESLIHFGTTVNWSSLIEPVHKYDEEYSFLWMVEEYIARYNRNDIAPNPISEAIFESMTKYNIHHVRMWIYGYTAQDHFSYVGYREIFRQLDKGEQNLFAEKAKPIIKKSLRLVEVEEVEPCINPTVLPNGKRRYIATAANFHFGEYQLRLRDENEAFTAAFPEPFSSPAYNRISKKSLFFQKFKFEVITKNGKILKISGLENFFLAFQVEKVKKILSSTDPKNTKMVSTPSRSSYVEDLLLRKKVIKYLIKNQTTDVPLEPVAEPQNWYRRLKNSTKDKYEKAMLFTISSKEGYTIVWENIDFSDDRATYIFRSSKDNLPKQIQKIKSAIQTLGNFRSTLTRKDNDGMLKLFRNNYGFVKKIKKKRGKLWSFQDWHEKFIQASHLEVPALPTKEEDEMLEIWPWVKPTSFGSRPKTKGTKRLPIYDPETGAKTEMEITKKDEILILLKNLNKNLKQLVQ
jgi:hypothetical protein